VSLGELAAFAEKRKWGVGQKGLAQETRAGIHRGGHKQRADH
jgi:hypothetical protein